MSVKLLTEYHFEFLSLKGGCTVSEARLNLHLSKCHIVGNHMSWLIFKMFFSSVGSPISCDKQYLLID